MIFQHTWKKILDGSKTETRRLYKKTMYVRRGQPGEVVFAPGTEHPIFINDEMLTVPDNGIIEIGTSGRPLYSLERPQVIQPGRGLPSIWLDPCSGKRIDPVATFRDRAGFCEGATLPEMAEINQWLRTWGFIRPRVCFTQIDIEPLSALTDEAAQREGEPDRESYFRLWDHIHTKRGTRIEDDPQVIVLRFEVDPK